MTKVLNSAAETFSRANKVITIDMIGKVRRMHFRDHISLSDIARRTGLSHNTVKKWARAPVEREPKYRRSEHAGKLAAFPQSAATGA